MFIHKRCWNKKQNQFQQKQKSEYILQIQQLNKENTKLKKRIKSLSPNLNATRSALRAAKLSLNLTKKQI